MGCSVLIDVSIRQLAADGRELSVTPFGVRYQGSLSDDNEANLVNLAYTRALVEAVEGVARQLAVGKATLTGADPLIVGALATGALGETPSAPPGQSKK